MSAYFPCSKPVVVIFIFLLPLFFINAQEDTAAFQYDSNEENFSFWKNLDWAYRGSILFFLSGNDVQGADPSPIIPSLGVSASWNFRNNFWFEITEDVYFHDYEYNTELKIPLPCNQPNRSAFVMGFLTGFLITYIYPLGNTGINIRGFIGPVMDIRIAVKAFGLNHPDDFKGDIETNVNLQVPAIRKYFWSDFHWFYPVIGIGADYPVNEKFLLGLDLRFWYPASSATDWRIGVGLRLTPRKDSL